MTWLSASVLSYLILAVVFLIDKYILTGPVANPKLYVFYSGILGILILLLIPFVGFYVPPTSQILLALAAGVLFIYGLFRFYKTLQLFEPSRVVPAIGALTALFTFILVYLFSSGTVILRLFEIVAFALLVLGSFLITYQKTKNITFKSFQLSAVAGFFLAFYMVLTKYVYLGQSFWNGLIWIRIGAFLAVIFLLFFSKEMKEIIFKKRKLIPQKPALIIFNQTLGAGGNLLLNWAIALAPLAYLSIVNALIGTQYIFLLIFAAFLSFKFPQILKEEISREIILQKVVAILLIGGGLALLAS